MITVDARPAGAGKTTKEIWPLIDKTDQCLVVVPSLALQDTYSKMYTNFTVIRSTGDNRASRDLLTALSRGDNRIICTSQCFIQTPIPPSLRTRTLIIDEVFQPWTADKWDIKTQGPDFKWQDYATIDLSTAAHGEGWCELTKNFQDVWIDDSRRFTRFSNPNYTLYQTLDTYNKICQLKQDRVYTVLEVNPEILSHWPQVHVAAAAFEHTFFRLWLDFHGVKFKIKHAHEPLTRPLRLHHTNFAWSKRKHTTHTEVKQQFIEYVKKHATRECLRLRNKNIIDDIFNDEVNLKHNSHGLNQYTAYTSVVLESSLNFDPSMLGFLTKFIGIDTKQVITASAGYTYYQTLMRSNLRTKDGLPVDVFVLDQRYAESLFEFFNLKPQDLIEISVTKPEPVKRRPRSDKGLSRGGKPASVRMRQMRMREQKQLKAITDLLQN